MKLQKLLSYTRRAVDDYGLIDEGDTVAVAVSGGKDSLTLLHALSALRRFYPQSFRLVALSVHLGFEGFDLSPVQKLCDELDVPYDIVETNIARIIFEDRKESNPCSLCSKLRKGAFNKKAKALGCNKIAFAHHKDDVVETLLMSLLFEGRIQAFPPKTYLDRMELTVIRPLIYVEEAEIKGFWNRYDLPVRKNPCPSDGYTKREYAKNLVKQLEEEHPGAKNRMFHAIREGNLEGWGVV